MMHSLKWAALAAFASVATAMPAQAAVVINAANVGYNFVIDYAGWVENAPTDQVSGLGNFTFDGVSLDGYTYKFSYAIKNDSIVDSRIRSFGMNTTGTVTGIASTGAFAFASEDGQFPGSPIDNKLDLCFRATSNGQCNGGNGGVLSNPDETGVGTFSVTFASVMSSVSFDDFAIRFQSINPSVNGSSSGLGLGSVVSAGGSGPISAAPEPGTWLMLLGGFGLVGFAMRRRHSLVLRPQIA